jgi:hypothetical protein
MSDLVSLNTRPKKSTDFVNGNTSADAFDVIQFGDSINYVTTDCSLGYFPPGVICPSPVSSWYRFSLRPNLEKTGGQCYTQSQKAIGLWVNGVSIYSGMSGSSYNNNGVWHYVNPVLDKYDRDICGGRTDSNTGLYFHRGYSQCLADRIGEAGESHSPIYGWAFDGLPIYGPYNGASTLATSCWAKRNYTTTSTSGCTTSGRTCIPKNPFAISSGYTTLTGYVNSIPNSIRKFGIDILIFLYM